MKFTIGDKVKYVGRGHRDIEQNEIGTVTGVDKSTDPTYASSGPYSVQFKRAFVSGLVESSLKEALW